MILINAGLTTGQKETIDNLPALKQTGLRGV
jgi:hypothetical protein